MSEVKWIKLQVDIFTKVGGSFDAIKALPDANDLELIWIKLLCLAGNANDHGMLTISTEIPYTDEMLAKAFDFDLGTVQRALGIFQKLGMIEVTNDIYKVSNWSKYQSVDALDRMREQNKIRQQNFRNRQKALPKKEESEEKRNVTVTLSPSYISYSFISHSNTENYIYIKNKGTYKNLIYINNNKALDDGISEWFAYKDEKPRKNNHYDTERGMESTLSEIVKKDKELGTGMVLAIIHASMARSYQGIIWDLSKSLKPERIERKAEPQKVENKNEPDFSDPDWMEKMSPEELQKFLDSRR